jgi:3-deoxy-D-manno-octulosonate 8-phosphate phosphatase (KDO 8-P phosphatase)
LQLLETFAKINTFVFDVDGVMTDGSLQIVPNGQYIRTFNIKDGYALQLAVKSGYTIFVITGSSSDAVAERLQYLGITHFYQKVNDKKALLTELLQSNNLSSATALFMGDDMPDIAAMQSVAIACCPADAVTDVLQIANYISPLPGGKGCVRDVIEKVMRLQGKWNNGVEAVSI